MSPVPEDLPAPAVDVPTNSSSSDNPPALALAPGEPNATTGNKNQYARQGAALARLRLTLALQRETNKFTQEELAANSGVSLAMLRNVERGIQLPSIEIRRKFATVLGEAVMHIDWPPPKHPPKNPEKIANRRYTEQGKALLALRQKLGDEQGGYISQEKLAKLSGISGQMIKSLEVGQLTPSEATKRKLALALGERLYQINWPPAHLKADLFTSPNSPAGRPTRRKNVDKATTASANEDTNTSNTDTATATATDPLIAGGAGDTSNSDTLLPHQRLAQLRQELPASKMQVAQKLGISWELYHRIEALGKSIVLFDDPGFNLKERFAQVFGEQVLPILDELLERAEPVRFGPKPKK